MGLSTLVKRVSVRTKIFSALIAAVLVLVTLTLTQDLLRSKFNSSSFYLSEAFLFSSFWWFFIPFCDIQFIFVRRQKTENSWSLILVMLLPIATHLIAFPILVWLSSSVFFDHTYAVLRILKYTLAEHMYALIVGYTLPVLVYTIFQKWLKTRVAESGELEEKEFCKSLLVSIGKKKINITVSEILYFSAESPYINIHLHDKKYLHNETLKAIAEKLQTGQFIRIHKSVIVNIAHVKFYTSRLNGDYDLTLDNDTKLRLSRKFAVDFKRHFQDSSSYGKITSP